MRFHDAATIEMVEAAEWYESKAIGVGARFLDAIETAVTNLTEHPNLGPVWSHPALPPNVEVRRFPLRVFPFLIVYVLKPEPTVVAIAHGRRDPAYWIGRTGKGRGPED